MFASAFQYPFTVDGVNANIIQQGDNFELRINNLVFSHLYNQERTRQEFVYEEDELKQKNERKGLPDKFKPRIFEESKPELPKGQEIKQHTEFQEISHFDFANFELHQKGKADFGAWNSDFSQPKPQSQPQSGFTQPQFTQFSVPQKNPVSQTVNLLDLDEDLSHHEPEHQQPGTANPNPPPKEDQFSFTTFNQPQPQQFTNSTWMSFEQPAPKPGSKTPFDMF